jgi:hypothetical protein
MLVGRILSDIGDDKPLGLMRRLRAVNDRIIIEIDSQVSMALSIAEFPESDLLIELRLARRRRRNRENLVDDQGATGE